MHHGISWAIVQRMMIDAPNIVDTDSETKEIAITDQNAEEVLQQINAMIR